MDDPIELAKAIRRPWARNSASRRYDLQEVIAALDSDERWSAGYNCGVVAVAAHLRRKADLFRECGEVEQAKRYYEMSAVALEKMKPTGVRLETIPTPAGTLKVNRQGEE